VNSGALERYVPGRDGPFGFDEAAHLARRAGFSLAAEGVEELARAGPDGAVELLFRGDEGDEARALAAQAGLVCELDDLPKLQALWVARMAATRAPALEKLALFLHGHFATSFEKVKRSAWMWQQYRLFREQGAGPFRELLLAVSRDPAMLVWLDSNSNERGRPNENYAREVMELFSLGVGHYGERDVQEAARAFSGWHVKDGRFWFNPRAHDDGEKELLGRRGPLDGGDVVDLCVANRACPRFLADKLLRFYVAPDPPEEWVEGFAAVLVQEELAIGPALRRLFASRAFYAGAARVALVGSPIDFCVGTLRRLRGRARWRAVAEAAAAMGQALFAPPNVKGWDGDRAWINSRTLLERARFATGVAYGDGSLGAVVAWEGVVDGRDREDPARLVAVLAHRLLQRPLPAETAARLEQYAASEAAERGEARVRRVAHLILTAPEAQLT